MAEQTRPMLAHLGLITRSDGSVQLSQGRTVVIAGAFGPVEVNPRKELIDRSTVEVKRFKFKNIRRDKDITTTVNPPSLITY